MTRAALAPGLHSCPSCSRPHWRLEVCRFHRHLSTSSAGAQDAPAPPEADTPQTDRSVTRQPSECPLLSARLLSACCSVPGEMARASRCAHA